MVYFGFVVLMLVVAITTFRIQFEGKTTVFSSSNSAEEKMPTRTVQRIPRRGEILDENYTPLVTSVSFYDIHMDPTVPAQDVFDREVTDLASALAKEFPVKSASEYEQFIRSARAKKKRYILIKRKATNEERKRLRAMPIFKLGRLKGGLIDTEETIIRKRPHGEMLKRTLGYYKEQNGNELRVGIEGAYNEYLAGEPGEEVEQKISTGWKKTGQIVREAVEGADVVTTIDKEIQEVAQNELLNQLRSQRAKRGSVIVMDVKTGYIKAIASLTQASDGNYYESYNHAVGTKEVPGSTFKLAALMAALEDGKVNLKDSVNAYGVYKFYDSKLTDAHEGGYGRITIKQAFEKSSNVIAKVIYQSYRNEPSLFINRLESFGLTEPLGLDLQGEPDPTVYRPGTKNWSGISLPWMAIGYEVQQTPLQTLAFYNAVANNGAFVKPQFVKEIRRSGQVVKTYPPVILRDKICSQSTLDQLKECLVGVMKNGTGKSINSSLFDIAGKTGTARILNDDLKYGKKGEEKYQASFVGFFPADEPIYSCIVVVSAPSQDIYGATVSGTVFTAIANKVYATQLKYHDAINEHHKRVAELPQVYAGHKEDLALVLSSFHFGFLTKESDQWVNVQNDGKKFSAISRYEGKNTVPNVLGLTAKDAIYLIESTGMRAKIKGIGKVKTQSIAPGKPVYKGGVVILELE